MVLTWCWRGAGVVQAWHYFEAPWLLRRNDTYYMSFMMEYSDCPGNGGHRYTKESG